MTVGPLEGLTSSIGDELTELVGFRSTRLSAQFLPEQSVSTGVNTANYTQALSSLSGTWTWDGTTTVLATDTSQVAVDDYVYLDSDAQLFRITEVVANTSVTIENPDGLTIPSGATGSSVVDPAVVTLSTGTYAAAVAGGQRFRIQSGTYLSVSAIVDTRDSDTQITLLTGLPASLTDVSWEIVIDAETTATVETTLDWSATGTVYIDGVQYTYASKTLTTLVGMQHFDGITFVDGAKQQHEPLAEVLDFTREFSGLDTIRRSLLVDYATGEDLTVIGANHAVPRPPELTDDDTYRALIRAVSYAPRGPIAAMEQALTALFGAAGYEIFEDNTIGTNRDAAATGVFVDEPAGTINNPATVFFRRNSNREEDSSGKTFLDTEEIRPLDSATQVTLDSAPDSPIRVAGVRLAPEPGRRLIDAGGTKVDVMLVSSAPPVWEVTDPAAGTPFAAAIEPGDTFRILSGAAATDLGTITGAPDGSNPTTSILYVSPLRGTAWWEPSFTTFLLSLDYEVVRPVSNFRHYKPSVESYVEYDGDAGTTQWTAVEVGGATEASDATLTDDTYGQYLAVVDPSGAGTLSWTRPLRILPTSSVASWEFNVSFDDATLSSAEADLDQATFILRDGAREIALGFREDTGAIRFEFYDTAGPTALGSNGSMTSFEWATIRIEKHKEESIRLFKDNVLVTTVPYTSFATTSTRNLEWGVLSVGGSGGAELYIKQMDWHVEDPTDLWNIHVTAGTANGGTDQLDDGGANGFFVGGDVGKSVRVSEVTTGNITTGSNPLGEYEVLTVPTADRVTVIGQTYGGAYFDAAYPAYIFVRDRPDAFIYPNSDSPHKVEIIDGVNLGTYSISRFLEFDATTGEVRNPGEDIVGDPLLTIALFPDHQPNPLEERLYVVEVSNPPAAGFETATESQWRMVPLFSQDFGPVHFELVDTGSEAAGVLTFRESLTTEFGLATGELVAVSRTTVLSAQAEDALTTISETSPGPPRVLSHHAFWLFDDWGYARRVLDALTVAGVIPDFDSLFRDDAGLHILE